MNCHQETQQLGSYLDGQLPSSARYLLEAHLASCSACRSELPGIMAAVAAGLAAADTKRHKH